MSLIIIMLQSYFVCLPYINMCVQWGPENNCL